jgi:hypothetical protein
VGNKVALALTVLAAAIIVSACGGTQGASSTSNTQPSGLRIVTGKHPRTDPRKSCDAQHINSRELGIGACTEGGVQYVVSNYGSVVRLNSLVVGVAGLSVAPADAGHGRRALPQRDAFLRITLQVQNRGNVPQRFIFGQTMLGVGADNYLERADVERMIHVESLAAQNGGQIQPGETQRGDVLFDITREDYEQLEREGRFFIWNFGQRATPQFQRGNAQVGQIRLYAVERS